MTYAFTFNASACTGCKACQEACRDKNNLPGGVLWRWVVEVSGGEWQQVGSAWENSVFAYNLSLACSHCVHPKCAGVCPVDAFHVRPDGIVLIDTSKCMGCGYCAWACPYGAPQYIPEQGIMTKCNFCCDSLDAGLPPSCVAACPLRVLDYQAVADASLEAGRQALWLLPASEHPFPLPPYSRTEPHLVITPHPAMPSPLEKQVANREEIPPGIAEKVRKMSAIAELPLVAFTLLAQMAAGMAVCLLVLPSTPLPLLLSMGGLLGFGGAIAFLHLGRKRNAWRAAFHLKKSWLSREILLAGLFGISWAVTVGLTWLGEPLQVPWLMALLGVGLVYSMSQVYHLRAVPAWNTWRTPASFFLSAAALGSLGVNLAAPRPGWAAVAGLALAAELGIALAVSRPVGGKASRARIALLGLGILGSLLMGICVDLVIPLFLLVLAAEGIGRWQFYARRGDSHF
jgi:anaerobic dimethyl sulfoxide reductase subunit B (iron-sulfur subunit)